MSSAPSDTCRLRRLPCPHLSTCLTHTDPSSLLFYFFLSGCPQRIPPLSARSRPRPRIGARSSNPPSPLTKYIRIPVLSPHTCPLTEYIRIPRSDPAHMPIWIHSAPIPPLSSPARHPRVTGERRRAQGPHHIAAHATSPVPRVRRPIRDEPRGDSTPADRVLRKVRDLAQISRRSRADLAQISGRSRADLGQISRRFISACMRCVSPTSEIAISGYVDGWSHRTTRCTVQASCRCGERTPRRRR